MDHLSSFQRVARDIVDLCELQLQLLSVDSQEARQKLVRAVVCGAASVALGGSALTVSLIGLGMVLGQQTRLTTGAAIVLVAVIAFVIVALLLLAAFGAIKSAAAAMQESKSEFVENLRWLKATLVSPQTSPRNQMRSDSFSDHRASASAETGRNYHSQSVSSQP